MDCFRFWLREWDLKFNFNFVRICFGLSAIRRAGTTNDAMSDPDSARRQRFFKGLDLQSTILENTA